MHYILQSASVNNPLFQIQYRSALAQSTIQKTNSCAKGNPVIPMHSPQNDFIKWEPRVLLQAEPPQTEPPSACCEEHKHLELQIGQAKCFAFTARGAAAFGQFHPLDALLSKDLRCKASSQAKYATRMSACTRRTCSILAALFLFWELSFGEAPSRNFSTCKLFELRVPFVTSLSRVLLASAVRRGRLRRLTHETSEASQLTWCNPRQSHLLRNCDSSHWS